jgi:hypothetical protein
MKAHATQSAGRRTRRPVPPVHSELRPVEPRERESMIAAAAYYRAEARGFAAGHELEDWLAAEREIDLLLAAELCADH